MKTTEGGLIESSSTTTSATLKKILIYSSSSRSILPPNLSKQTLLGFELLQEQELLNIMDYGFVITNICL